jgi:hypothetical protein
MQRLIPILAIILSQCVSSQESQKDQIDKCEKNNQISADYYVRYYEDSNKLYLDSALLFIDEVLVNCEKQFGILSLRKLSILSIKQDYPTALKFIDTFDEEVFSELPYFQNFLKERFMAMKSQAEGDLDMRDFYLRSIIGEINKFLEMNRTKVDSLISLPDIDSILKNSLGTAITQFYYYKRYIDGFENVKDEIIAKQEENSWNKEFSDYLISFLKEDLMVFNGI